MRTESVACDCIRIFDADDLDAITVVMQDRGGSGQLIVECGGKAWSAYFGALGDCSLRGFLAGCHHDYVANRLDLKGGEHLSRIAAAVITPLNNIPGPEPGGTGEHY